MKVAVTLLAYAALLATAAPRLLRRASWPDRARRAHARKLAILARGRGTSV
ncbi:hypothetical protein [Frankia sp. Cas3]|uniref:hypothetical protein n=1 Tax=Frankia sp. Cas3 TaxID=3073926 RepID=UPI002AD54BCB|nr:hypothetical protein [Frankia sp. Cas3]